MLKFVFLLSCWVPVALFAHPVVKRTKSCGGWFGYSYVRYELVPHEGTETGFGWNIECTGRGFSSCPKKGRGSKLNETEDLVFADVYDHAVAEDLINDVELKMETGSKSGSYKITKQIQGQSFARAYTVSWQVEEVECSATEKGEKYTVEVDVIYVPN